MKSLLGKLGIILIGLAIFTYAEVWGEDWKYFNSNEDFLCYYDAQSITRPSQNIVSVRTRKNYTEKSVLDWVREFGKEYENLSYGIDIVEINCSEKTCRIQSMTYYDSKGKVIESYSISNPSFGWDFIPPKSIIEVLYKAVCK